MLRNHGTPRQDSRGWGRRATEWVVAAVLGALVGAVATDCVFNGCRQSLGLFDFADKYVFTMQVGDGRDGTATSNYATPLFERYEKHLRERDTRLEFHPQRTKKMLYCVGFGPEGGSVEQVFDSFLTAYRRCIRKTEDSTQGIITISPAWGDSDLARDEHGQLWCGCPKPSGNEEESSFTPAPLAPDNCG